jgi:hypothetical protein
VNYLFSLSSPCTFSPPPTFIAFFVRTSAIQFYTFFLVAEPEIGGGDGGTHRLIAPAPIRPYLFEKWEHTLVRIKVETLLRHHFIRAYGGYFNTYKIIQKVEAYFGPNKKVKGWLTSSFHKDV